MGAIACALIVTVCVSLALWQLRRLDEKRSFNAHVERRTAVAPASIEEILPRGGADPAALTFRRVIAVGRYDHAREIVITSQSFRGFAGNHVVTPLITSDGRAVLIDRGWVPLQHNEPPVSVAAPPAGTVRVEGVLQETQRRRRFGPKLPLHGPLRQAFRVELPRLAPQFPYELYPMWLQLGAQQPPQAGSLPRPVPVRRLDAGPHLSYAIQWFAFATIAVVIYATLFVRARKRARDPEVRPDPVPDPS